MRSTNLCTTAGYKSKNLPLNDVMSVGGVKAAGENGEREFV